MALAHEGMDAGVVPARESGEFVRTDSQISHRTRAKQILKAHPEVRKLISRNPWTLAVIVGVTALQFLIAWLVKDQPWWVIVLVAFFIGAFANHSLFVMIHEATHRLIFKSLWANRLAGILCNFAQLAPSFTPFERAHLRHHTYLGVEHYDADLPPDWEIKLFNRSAFGRAMWILSMPLLQSLRPLFIKEGNEVDGWHVANTLAVIVVGVLTWWAWGWGAVGYLLISTFFSVGGLHPVSARWIQEHYMIEDDQETYSYYGPINLLDLNMGYHNEHHDLPTVPWNKLPDLKRLAPEFYDPLRHHTSYTKLLWTFVMHGSPAITSRMVRLLEAARSGKVVGDDGRGNPVSAVRPLPRTR
ncbi:MAG: fatty acid desaturase [Hyphomicrobiales bacterium]